MGLGLLLIFSATKKVYLQPGLLVLFFSIGITSLARSYVILSAAFMIKNVKANNII
jgi:hypothetical protein